jgi:hypothetical protein
LSIFFIYNINSEIQNIHIWKFPSQVKVYGICEVFWILISCNQYSVIFHEKSITSQYFLFFRSTMQAAYKVIF